MSSNNLNGNGRELLNFNRKYKFVFENERYRCGTDGCSYHSPMGSELNKHIKKRHPKRQIFRCWHCDEKIRAENSQKSISVIDVLHHLDLHGSDLFYCIKCAKLFSSEFDVQLHFTRNHFVNEFKYTHKNFDAKGQAMRSDDISMLFECNICGQGIRTVAKAVEHFKVNHCGASVDIAAIQFTQRTASDMAVMTIAPHKAFNIQQHMICDHCDATVSTKERLLQHQRQSHATLAPVIRLSSLMCFNNLNLPKVTEMTKTNSLFDRHIFYECEHCTGNYFSSVEEVHEHWTKQHDTGDSRLPFHFLAIPLVSCAHCQCLSTFDGLRQHYVEKHPSVPFVAVNQMNQKECALCTFTGTSVTEHFYREHLAILKNEIRNPVRLTEDKIDGLLGINVKKKHKCTVCKAILENEEDMRNHALDVHNTFDFEPCEIFDNQSVQLIGNCCQTAVDQLTFFEHLASHKFWHYCPKCTFRTEDSFEFMNHGIEAHDVHNDACTLNLKYLKEQYWSSKYVFGNGLVVNKCNLVGTSIDDSHRFKEFVETLLVEKEKNYSATF